MLGLSLAMTLGNPTLNAGVGVSRATLGPEMVSPIAEGIGDWVAINNGVLSFVSNELVITGDGATGYGGGQYPLTLRVGKVYRMTGTGRRGTSAGQIIIRPNSSVISNIVETASTSNVSGSVDFTATVESDPVIAIINADPAVGNVVVNALSVKQMPAEGYTFLVDSNGNYLVDGDGYLVEDPL